MCFLLAFECLIQKCPPAPRWLMTSEELSTYEAESYPPPCVDPSFFEGPYGPRHGWAMIPQSLYKTEKNAGRCWNSSCDRFGARFVTVHPKNQPKSLVLLQIWKIPKMLMIISTVGSSGDGRASVWGVSALEMALLKD